MLITPEETFAAAKESGFLKRSGGKINPFDFLMTLVFRMSHSFPPALSTIISFLKIPVSRSGLHQKFTEKATCFFRRCLDTIMVKQLMKLEIVEPFLLEQFNRVLVVDSSSWDVPPSLSNIFPGSGGSASIANCKLQCIYDYKSGSVISVEDRKGIEPDQSYSQKLGAITQEGDLFLFDLGYWSFMTFYTIGLLKGYFISRFNTIVNFWYSSSGEEIKLDLGKFLKKQSFPSTEIEGYIKSQEGVRVNVRLIAFQVPQAVADKRRRKLREQAKKKGRTASDKSLQLCDWSLFITNASEKQIPDKMIRTIYRVRWSVELIFRSWKSILRMHKCNVKKNADRLKCELYAKLIFAVIVHTIHSNLQNYLWSKERREISFDKLWKFMVSHSEGLHNAIKRSLKSFSMKVNSFVGKIIKECEKYHQKSRKTTLQMIDEYIGDPEPIKIDLKELDLSIC